MMLMEDDTVLITKKRLAELEFSDRLLDALGERLAADRSITMSVWNDVRELTLEEDINNGEYDSKD